MRTRGRLGGEEWDDHSDDGRKHRGGLRETGGCVRVTYEFEDAQDSREKGLYKFKGVF